MTHAGIFPDLIFVSLEDWDDIWRRNQFLCTGLAERFPNARFLFVGLPRDISHSLRRGKVRDMLGPTTTSVQGHPNITVLRPLKLLPNTLTWGRRFNEAHARIQIRRTAARLGLHRPLLWLNPHSAVHMAGHLGERAVIYDITDDWTRLSQPEWLRRLTVAQDAALCRRADAVIVCSQKLFDLKRSLTENLHLIPNGVDVAHYHAVQASSPPPTSVAHWPHPVFGYTGTIHPDRVDIALIETLARAFPHGTVALIGPDMLSPTDRTRLDALGNVKRAGPVPYARVPDYMRAFDICITPHLITPFTESLNPIKLWEYLAGGKPIVSTEIAGFRDFPQYVRLAATPELFVTACTDALTENDTLPCARMTEAARHSWSSRIDDVHRVLQQLAEGS